MPISKSKPIILNSVFLRATTAVLAVFFGVVFGVDAVFCQVVAPDASAAANTTAADAAANVQAPEPKQESNEEAGPVEDEEFDQFNDPFEPAPATELPKEKAPEPVPETIIPKEIAPPTLTIRGAVWGVKPNKAIINDKIYGEGDTIEGTEAKILRIDESGILYEYQDKRFLLKRSQWNNAGKEGA